MVSILRLGKYNGQVSAKYHILCFMSPNKIASKFWNSLLAPSRKRVQLSETCMTCMFLAPIRKIFNHNFGSNNFVIPKYVLTFELQIRELLAFNYQCFSMPKHLRIQKSIQFQKLFWPFTVWINCCWDKFQPSVSNLQTFFPITRAFFSYSRSVFETKKHFNKACLRDKSWYVVPKALCLVLLWFQNDFWTGTNCFCPKQLVLDQNDLDP